MRNSGKIIFAVMLLVSMLPLTSCGKSEAPGLSSGGVIAAGIFAFLAIIGVFPRLIGVTHTRCHVILYETLLILGDDRDIQRFLHV